MTPRIGTYAIDQPAQFSSSKPAVEPQWPQRGDRRAKPEPVEIFGHGEKQATLIDGERRRTARTYDTRTYDTGTYNKRMHRRRSSLRIDPDVNAPHSLRMRVRMQR